MVPDFQTSMKLIRESNQDMVSLIQALRQFLSQRGTITITAGGNTYTLPTLPEIIAQYKGGNFDEIILRDGDNELHLSNMNGHLLITDSQGHLAPIEVSTLKFSTISDCVLAAVSVTNCNIDNFEAANGVTANKASVQNLTVNAYKGTSASFKTLVANILAVDYAAMQKLEVRRMIFNPRDPVDVFADAFGPYDYSSNNALFEPVSGFARYVCNPAYTQSRKSPESMGFVELPLDSGRRLLLAPDMVTFQGNTEYDDYANGDAGKIANCWCMGTGPSGTVSMPNTVWPVRVGFDSNDGPITFGHILGWPIRSYSGNTANDPSIPAGARSTKGTIFLHEISAADIGRIIYIRTLGNSWRINRRLTARYYDGAHYSDALDMEYRIPPYTCLRLRLNRVAEVVDSHYTLYHNVLELT